MSTRIGSALLLATCLACPPARAARSKAFAIAIDGRAMVSGGLQAAVSGNTHEGSILQLTIDFGEVSPLNRNRLVVVVVPIGLRSSEPFELDATLSATVDTDANAIQLSDVGFGWRNFRPLGKFATACGANSQITAPFNSDPSVNVDLTRRASYTSTLADVGLSRVLISGPRLSSKNVNNRNQNGYGVEAVLAIAPQFYATGTFRVTLILTMRPGPPRPCAD